MDMTKFKMIYKERVYYPLTICPTWSGEQKRESATSFTPMFLDVTYVDEDGMIRQIEDESFMFQFVRIPNQ